MLRTKNKKDCNHATCEAGKCRRLKAKKRVKQLVPLPKLLKKAEKLCNEFIRARDQYKACVSCGSDKGCQAGHYIPVGKSSYLRYDERNIHLQCIYCNKYQHGNPITYRIELRKRIGDFELEKLERDFIENPMYKWTREALQAVIEYYSEKLKVLKAA